MGSPSSEHFDKNAQDKINQLRRGCLLHATEILDDPNFSNTLVVLCAYSSDGAYGLILNRPAHMPLSEVFDVEEPFKQIVRTVYFGGPVQQDALQIISKTVTPKSHSLELSPNYYLGGDWNSLSEILTASAFENRLFLGYAGWITSQLEIEIASSAWDVYQCDLELVFEYEEVLRSGEHAVVSQWLKVHSVPGGSA